MAIADGAELCPHSFSQCIRGAKLLPRPVISLSLSPLPLPLPLSHSHSLSLLLPHPSPSSKDMRHHFKVSQSLKDLPNEDLITLGGALGLSFPKLKKMRDLPSEMVAAWLRKEDNVLKYGKPTWRLLATALKDIGQNGVADSILQNVRT